MRGMSRPQVHGAMPLGGIPSYSEHPNLGQARESDALARPLKGADPVDRVGGRPTVDSPCRSRPSFGRNRTAKAPDRMRTPHGTETAFHGASVKQ